MNNQSIEILLHPVIIRIIIAMLDKKEITTKEILELIDVSQATLYRYMSKLKKLGIIKISKEEFKRGSYEKSYQLLYDPISELGKFNDEGKIEDKQNLFMLFMMNIINEYNVYTQKADSNMTNDKTGYRTYPLYLSPAENQEFTSEIGSLLKKYISNKSNTDRTLYNFSFIHLKGDI